MLGNTVLILPSYALTEMRLTDLVGCPAILKEEVMHGDKTIGFWVELNKPFMDEIEWFIPYSSIIC